jgi:hypothetical protein
MFRRHPPRHPLLVRVIRSALGWTAAAALVVFALWLLKLLYIDRSWEEEMMSRYRIRGQAQAALQREPPPPRFHLDIPYSLDTLLDPPVCFTCHTAYPHMRDVRSRAYLNMHGAFLACEVCHHRPQEGESLEYVWITDRGDQPVRDVEGSRGVYGAHIYPARRSAEGHLERLGKRVNDPRWAALAEQAAGLSSPEQHALRGPAHDDNTGTPLDCRECHRVGGVLDFTALGYAPPMVTRLEHLEVVEMLQGTTQFYFPDLRGTITSVQAGEASP